MDKRACVAGPLLASLVAGCWGSVPVANVAPLLEEGHQNQLAAYSKHRGERLRIAGVVAEAGINHYGKVVGGVSGINEVTAYKQGVPYAYLVLVDRQNPGRDHVLCIFPDDDVKDPGRLNQGSQVVVRGRFERYLDDRRGLGLVLQSCELE
jgi:hypothetical protein